MRACAGGPQDMDTAAMASSLIRTAVLPAAAPLFHRLDDRAQGVAGLGQRVLDARRSLTEAAAVDDAGAFQFPQPLGEHAVGHTAGYPQQLGEPSRPVQERPDEVGAPPSTEKLEAAAARAGRLVGSGRRRRTVIHAANVALLGWTVLIPARSFFFVSNEKGSVGGRSMSETAGVIVLVGRIVFAIPFLVAGFAHFRMGQQMVAYARSMGAPLPALGGWPAGLWLLVSGLSVLLGVWPDIGALMLAAWGVPTAWYIHGWWRYEDEQSKQTQQTIFFRNVTFVGASIILAGAFVALGEDLRYVITPPLLSL